MRLIDADTLRQHIVDMVLNTYVANADDDSVYVANILVAGMLAQVEQQPTVDAIPIKWLYEQSDNPYRIDRFRNACDLVAMTWLEERKEE